MQAGKCNIFDFMNAQHAWMFLIGSFFGFILSVFYYHPQQIYTESKLGLSLKQEPEKQFSILWEYWRLLNHIGFTFFVFVKLTGSPHHTHYGRWQQ